MIKTLCKLYADWRLRRAQLKYAEWKGRREALELRMREDSVYRTIPHNIDKSIKMAGKEARYLEEVEQRMRSR